MFTWDGKVRFGRVYGWVIIWKQIIIVRIRIFKIQEKIDKVFKKGIKYELSKSRD